MRLNRRQVLQATLFGGLVGTFAGLAPDKGRAILGRAGAGAGASTGTLDSYDILRNAVRFGQRIQLGRTARADTPPDDSVLVTIKVMNHIHTPLCFALGQLSDDQTTVSYGGTRIQWEDRFQTPATLALLRTKGLELPSDNPRFRQLRLNKWWADMLATGADESGSAGGLGAGDVGAFPAEADVAVQAVLGVSQTDLSLNHSFQNCALGKSTDMTRGGDIGYHCAKQGLITSPLGLVCLNMGDLVEITDSTGDVPNRVLTNDLAGVAALGRSVDTYTKVVAQAVGLGLVDEALVSKFDAFVKSDTTISDQLTNSRAALKASLTALRTASAMETQLHSMGTVTDASNFQFIGTAADQVARTEFLAQCKFVQQALEVPGKPFRNFTLLLNIADLNGAKLDTSAAAGGIPAGPQPYSYIEGMRQLAIGLNLLAQVIKKHRNVYVAVVAEGGRLAALTDSKVSHSILMGPGGAGNMKDFLYANAEAINSASDPYVADPNDGNGTLTGAGQKMPSGSVVANEAGGTIEDHITTGAVLNGLVRHLETKRGINDTTTAGLGKFVRIQTA